MVQVERGVRGEARRGVERRRRRARGLVKCMVGGSVVLVVGRCEFGGSGKLGGDEMMVEDGDGGLEQRKRSVYIIELETWITPVLPPGKYRHTQGIENTRDANRVRLPTTRIISETYAPRM